MNEAALPAQALLKQQAGWLAPARARLLRRVGIARRRRVLDLACGRGAVTGELVQRGSGTVVALDRARQALCEDTGALAGAWRICGDATRLPFADDVFELVFCQLALMWLDATAAVGEIRRVLCPGGVLVAVEPDYGGMIEHPPEIATCDLWLSALRRAGADPHIGRKLPGLLADAGFRTRVDLLERLQSPSAARFDLLRGLPLTGAEKRSLRQIEAADGTCAEAGRVVHLPVFLITAELP
ncbi:MAG: methyltransferase domain-containing protein [Pirellulales bacterium]|nr:methyltransferase domain-containing protein [Pirellulales bacterium]